MQNVRLIDTIKSSSPKDRSSCPRNGGLELYLQLLAATKDLEITGASQKDINHTFVSATEIIGPRENKEHKKDNC